MARQVLSFSGRRRLLIRHTCSWQHLLIDMAKAACNSQQVLDSSANVHGTSQYGISIVSARIAEMIEMILARNHSDRQLPAGVRRDAVTAKRGPSRRRHNHMPPQPLDEERQALHKSASNLKAVLERAKDKR